MVEITTKLQTRDGREVVKAFYHPGNDPSTRLTAFVRQKDSTICMYLYYEDGRVATNYESQGDLIPVPPQKES